jgi:hypothetical protein
MPDIVIDHIGGFCPVQADGTINGVPFYFRSRHTHWSIGIGEDPVAATMSGHGLYYRCEPWGDGPHDAGYMPVEVAQAFIEQCAKDFEEQQTHAH